MLNFTNYQGNAIKTWWDITTSHLLEWLLLRRQKITGVGEDVEEKGSLCTVGGNVYVCSQDGNKYGSS